eukprot:COSAG02_NODE_368_length_23727_cov_364.814367_17_plen_291_part_00
MIHHVLNDDGGLHDCEIRGCIPDERCCTKFTKRLRKFQTRRREAMRMRPLVLPLQRLALCGGAHPRIGSDCPHLSLPHDLLEHIAQALPHRTTENILDRVLAGDRWAWMVFQIPLLALGGDEDARGMVATGALDAPPVQGQIAHDDQKNNEYTRRPQQGQPARTSSVPAAADSFHGQRRPDLEATFVHELDSLTPAASAAAQTKSTHISAQRTPPPTVAGKKYVRKREAAQIDRYYANLLKRAKQPPTVAGKKCARKRGAAQVDRYYANLLERAKQGRGAKGKSGDACSK